MGGPLASSGSHGWATEWNRNDQVNGRTQAIAQEVPFQNFIYLNDLCVHGFGPLPPFPPVNSDPTEIRAGLFVLLLAACISFWQVIVSRTLSTRIRTVKSFPGLESVIFLFILLSWLTSFSACLVSFYLQITCVYWIAILQSIQHFVPCSFLNPFCCCKNALALGVASSWSVASSPPPPSPPLVELIPQWRVDHPATLPSTFPGFTPTLPAL